MSQRDGSFSAAGEATSQRADGDHFATLRDANSNNKVRGTNE